MESHISLPLFSTCKIIQVQKIPPQNTKQPLAWFHFNLHDHLFTVSDNACMYVGKEGAIRGVKCTIRFAPRCSFWHIGHLWWAGLVAPWHTGCVFGRRPAHPLRYFSPLVTIWGGDSVNKIDSTSLVDLLISLSLSVLQQPEEEIRAHTREFTQVFFFFKVTPDLNMPRSFLVKKYFSNKKPYYRESHLESQTGKFLPLSLIDWIWCICDCICHVELITQRELCQNRVADKTDSYMWR